MSPRSVLAAVFALELLGQGIQAQSLDDRRVGIFFGYTYADAENPSQSYVLGTSVIPNPPLHMQGGHVGAYFAQNRWLRWRVDLTAGQSAGFLGPGDTYVFGGPEFTFHAGRALFFAHSLFGHGEVDGGLFSTSRSGFAMAFGGGVDLRLTSHLSLRLIDADYLPSHFTGPLQENYFNGPTYPNVTSWNNNSRVSFGLVVKVGPKF